MGETTGEDRSEALAERVRAAAAAGEALEIVGGASKRFLGRTPRGAALEVAGHRGICSYEPTELVVTARAGTPLAELEQALAAERQMLPFEPPHLGAAATVGGTVACALSGPRRPWAGALRDYVLGVRVLTGRGEVLGFGGQVMKNVAGYDLSRLMAGSMGTLAVILEVSFKVLPQPACEATLAFDLDAAEALRRVSEWGGKPHPLSAACHDGERLRVRLSGTPGGVETACRRLGGERLEEPGFWEALREQRLAFFAGEGPLWRVSLPPAAAPLEVEAPQLIDWGGALRWLRGELDGERLRAAAAAAGGHAALFRGGDRDGEVHHPLPAALLAVHRRLKEAFDPQGILNPGRLYRDL